MALDLLKDIPEDSGYRKMVEELTRFRLKVVEKHEDVYEIEEKLNYGPVEHLIEAAENELTMIGIVKKEQAWEPRPLEDFELDAFEDTHSEAPFGDFQRQYADYGKK